MYHVEVWRMGAYHVAKTFDDEAAAIGFYLKTRADYPDWVVRRITVHESHGG